MATQDEQLQRANNAEVLEEQRLHNMDLENYLPHLITTEGP